MVEKKNKFLNHCVFFEKIRVIFSIIFFILGQFFLLTHKNIYLFLLFTFLSLILFFLKYIRGYFFSKKEDYSNFLLTRLNIIFLFASILLAVFGYFNINNGIFPFIFFSLSAILLFAIKINNYGFFYSSDINFNKEKKHKWEVFYIIFLVVVSYFLYFYKSDVIPAGAAYHEGVMATHFPRLESPNYIPYMPDDQANWSTFVFYLGLLFTKLFGYNIGSVRLPSAIFSLLSVLAFYFLLRRLTSSYTAAFITPLFMANQCFISLSRQFYPVTVLYLAPLLGLYFIIEGIYKNKWYYFLFAGFATGYSLHGYLAGRPIVLVFIVWLLVFMLINRNTNIIKYIFIFLGGFTLVALPVILTSIIKPEIVWHYVNFVDPNKGADFFSRIKQLIGSIMPHIRLFYTSGDIESLLKPMGDNFFSREPLAMVLFSVGFLLCCILFFRPLPLFLLLFFVLAIIPSLMSGATMLKRSSMTIPAIFLIVGFIFERIRFFLNSHLHKEVKIFSAVLIVVVVVVVISTVYSINGFFKIIINDPGIKLTFNYSMFKISEIIKKDNNKIIYINPLKTTLGINVGPVMLFPKKSNIKYFKFNHEVIYCTFNEILFVFEPFVESAMDLFKKIYPNSNIYIYKEKKKDAKFYKSGLSPWEKHYDHYNPFCYALAMDVKSYDIKKLQSSLIDKATGKERNIEILDINFAEKYAGQKLDLYGMFLVDSWQNTRNIRIILDWKNWEIFVDNKKIKNNSSMILNGGVHFLNIQGIVPRNCTGKLPLYILDGDTDLITNNLLVAMAEPYGMRLKYFEGENGWQSNKEKFIFYEFLYLKRIFDFPMKYPFSIVFEGKIKVDEDADYFFQNDPHMKCQIFINEKLVYDNINSQFHFQPIQESIKLNSNMKYDIKVFQNFYYTRPNFNTMIIYYKKSLNDKIQPVPASWITFF